MFFNNAWYDILEDSVFLANQFEYIELKSVIIIIFVFARSTVFAGSLCSGRQDRWTSLGGSTLRRILVEPHSPWNCTLFLLHVRLIIHRLDITNNS